MAWRSNHSASAQRAVEDAPNPNAVFFRLTPQQDLDQSKYAWYHDFARADTRMVRVGLKQFANDSYYNGGRPIYVYLVLFKQAFNSADLIKRYVNADFTVLFTIMILYFIT